MTREFANSSYNLASALQVFDSRTQSQRGAESADVRDHDAAKDELRKLKIIHESNGQAGLNLTDNLRLAAVECTKLLRPYGKTIYDATKHYLEYLEADKSELTTELIKSYLQTRKRAGLSERHLADIEGKLQCFGEPFGTRPVKTLTSREIEAWLYSLGNGELARQSWINWRAVLHAFFEQLFQEKILSANPIGAIRKPKHIREAPPIFTPEELSKLLGAASGHLVAPLAIQAFAGLRTSETLRLHWQNVQDSYIHVNAEIAKTSRRRLVKILPNLASWLEVSAKSRGSVWPNGARNYHDATQELARSVDVEWKHNGLRHSYASYHLAEFANADALALEMGRMVRDHYREVVTPEAAHRWWAIQPKQQPENVLRLKGSHESSSADHHGNYGPAAWDTT